ncbi:MAG: CHAT domain-containing tetratricopeptide repeat protein [Bacteroidota bacterium]
MADDDHQAWFHCVLTVVSALGEDHRYQEIDQLYTYTLDYSNKKLGAFHPDLWLIHYHQARHELRNNQDPAKAYGIASQSLKEVLATEPYQDTSAIKVYYLMGMLAHANAELNSSTTFFQEAATLAKEIYGSSSANYGVFLNALANAIYTQNQYQEAILPYQQARIIFEGSNNTTYSYATCIQNLAACLAEVGHFKESENLYLRADTIFQNYPKEVSLSRRQKIHLNLGILYQKWGRYELSREHMMTSLVLCNEFGANMDNERIVTEISLGELELHTGNYLLAIEYAHKAISMLDPQTDADELLAIPQANRVEMEYLWDMKRAMELKGLAMMEYFQGSKDQVAGLKSALEHFEQIGYIYHEIRRSLPSEQDQLLLPLFFQNPAEVLGSGLRCANALYAITGEKSYMESAFSLIEQSNGMVGFEKMLSRTNIAHNALAEQGLSYGDSLIEDIQQLQAQIRKREQGGQTFSAEDSRQLMLLRHHYRQWQDTFKNKHPDIRQLLESYQLADLQEIQQYLSTNDAIWISYHFSDQQNSYILAIDKHHTELIPVDLTPELLKQMSRWKEICASPDLSQKGWQTLVETGTYLYRRLLSPIDSRIPLENRALIINPHGPVNGLSFSPMLESPVQASPGNFRFLPYLIWKHPISYAQSGTSLLEQVRTSQPLANYHCLGLAYSHSSSPLSASVELYRSGDQDLPGTAQEIKNLSNILRGHYFWGDSASETVFRQYSGEADILHIALHGVGNHEQPYLIFRNQDTSLLPHQDGRLYISELSTIGLQAHLAVLSACETAQGKLHENEGVISMARAFISAGSSSVLMNLWRAHDNASVKLMNRFYMSLLDEKSKAEALQEAQTHYLKENNNLYAHPAYWGGLAVWGNPESLWQDSFSQWITYLLASLICLLSITLLYRYLRSHAH